MIADLGVSVRSARFGRAMMSKPGDPWPWPVDTPLERARRVAEHYRAALASVDPDECRDLDQQHALWGQAWVVPLTYESREPDELLTLAEVAVYAGVSQWTVWYRWRQNGLVVQDTGEGLRVCLRDLNEYLAARRRARQERLSKRRE